MTQNTPSLKTLGLAASLALGGTAANAQTAVGSSAEPSQSWSQNLAVYGVLSHDDSLHTDGGVFAGPVYNINSQSVSVDAYAYLFRRMTPKKSPLQVGLGFTAGISTADEGAGSINPMLRVTTNFKDNSKMAFANNLYIYAGLSGLSLGFSHTIPSKKPQRRGNSRGVWLEAQAMRP